LVKTRTPEAHPEEFKRVRAAYETLRSPLRRMELEVLSFDESAGGPDLGTLAAAAGEPDFDVTTLLLALEWADSDLNRTGFPEDESLVREEDLLEDQPA
jgi:curved DNA-binding protein CbpA